MRKDLDKYLDRADIDAVWVTGSLFSNPDMVYMTGIQHVNQADLFKLKDQEAVLFHTVDMEREEAQRSGLKSKAYFSKKPLADYIHDAGGDIHKAVAGRIKEALEEIGLTGGTVAISGVVEIGPQFAILEQIKQLMPDIHFTSFYKDSPFLAARMTKSSEEADHIRSMGTVTTEVIGRVQHFLQSCQVDDRETLLKEDGQPLRVQDIKKRINLWLAELGAENPEETIFAIGRDGGIPHSSGTPKDMITLGKPIVFDIFPRESGGGYFYDCTRTWCLGYAPEAVTEIYQQVLEVHQHIIADLKPGTAFKDYQKLACALFAEKGHITIAEDRTTQQGYLHSIGHGLGLDVHEKPFSGITAAEDDILDSGVVFTIEPGLYYPARGIGVRIEDTIYLNEAGEFEILADYPYDLVIPMEKMK